MATRSSESMKLLRKAGYRGVCKCEHFETFQGGEHNARPLTGQRAAYRGGYRKDLWGCGDIICFRRTSPGVLVVQCTTKQATSPHLLKYRRNPETRENILACLESGNRFVIHGWEKTTVPNKSDEGSHVRWVLHEREITATDLELTEADHRALGKLK